MNPNPRVVLAVALVGIGAGMLAVPAAADCPEFVGSVDTPGYAKAVAVSAGYVAVAVNMGGLAVYEDCGGALFADGFESGDTSVWSATVP